MCPIDASSQYRIDRLVVRGLLRGTLPVLLVDSSIASVSGKALVSPVVSNRLTIRSACLEGL